MSSKRPVRIVLQCRLSSSRLPAKVLLPVGGLPIAVLAAKRAMRGGKDLVLATSVEPSDDLLVAEATRHGVRTMRGPLDDVLGRFLLATQDLPDDALCVRLTGDNVFPDGDFIDGLIALLDEHDLSYLAHGGNSTQFPYGMAAEVFSVKALREAGAQTSDPFDREHVTPYIRRTYAPAQMPPFPGLDREWGHLRATVDTFDDYQTVAAVCAGLPDPVQVPWQELVARLQDLDGAPAFHVRPQQGEAAMVLGTVQLGLAYGRANTSGMPSEADAETIVHEAIRHGVTEIDTARAYGQSEVRLGRIMSRGWSSRATLLTKLDPLAALHDDLSDLAVTAMVRASVLASCHALKLDKLPVLMLHRAEHLDVAQGRAWRALQKAQSDGLIGRIGVSVQTRDELRRVAAMPEITHVQLPCNILDQRWENCADVLRARDDLRVHVRSAYLQGLLTPAAAEKWPAIEGVNAAALINVLDGLTRELGRVNMRDLCLAYLRGVDWIDGVVVGVETLAQLRDNLAMFRRPALSVEEIAAVRAALPAVPAQLLDPARWPKG
jgi:spore coat polysaccharide biosynthesis protein SpsF